MRSKRKSSNAWMGVFVFLVILAAYGFGLRSGTAILSVQAATSGTFIPQSGWSLLAVDSQETVCGNYAAVRSFDGNPTTFWHSQFCPGNVAPPHDIQINLGATYSISGFTYLPRQDGCSHGWISQYQFYVSADGVNWGNPVSSGTLNYGSAVTGCPGASVPPAIQVLFPSASAHYVQLRALSEITGGPYISMAELNLIAGSSTTTLSSLTLNPTTVTAGTTSQGTVTLSGAAPTSGAVIALSSSNIAAATVPASVTIASGATSATFTTSSGSVSTAASSTISATYSGSTVTAPLTVNPAPVVSYLVVSPSSVVGGNTALGTVTLSAVAPPSGAAVSLTSSNPAAASVPSSVTIAGGINTASFTVSTNPVASTIAVTNTASYGGATASTILSVQAVGTKTAIPQSGWSLLGVDSQETVCGNYAAVRSFDGNPTTFWHTQFCPGNVALPHNIQINLGATYSISGFTYLPRQDGCSHGWISQYQFYVSADGVNWGNPVSSGTLNYGSAVTGCPGASVPPAIQVLFPSASAHYVQLRALSEITGGPYISMAELNVLSGGGSTGGVPPTVSIISPAVGATVSGAITVTATASDSVGVGSVQLQVDGTNVGAADTTSPYNFSLNTATLTNGSHNLTAVATDTGGNQATSSAISITVSNQLGSSQPTYANNGAACSINDDPSQSANDPVYTYTCPLPNPTGAGNLLVVMLRYGLSTNPTVSFTDEVNNTYLKAAACSDSNTGTALYYVQNTKPGARNIVVNFSNWSGGVSMGEYEFYNVAATALDHAACGSGTSSTSLTPGSLSVSSGDLVFQFGMMDNTVMINGCAPSTQTGINWTQRTSMILDFAPQCAQYGIYTGATGSFSPSFTVNTAVSYVSAAAAFLPATAGTAPPTGIQVAYIQHDNSVVQNTTSALTQMPISGNLAVVMFTGSADYVTAISDGTNTWKTVGPTHTCNSTYSPPGDCSGVWYSTVATPGAYKLNFTKTTMPNVAFGDAYITYDIVGAASNPVDTGFGVNGLASATGCQGPANCSGSGSGGPVTGYTATPSGPNELILTSMGQGFDTMTGLTSPSCGFFTASHYTNETNSSHDDLNGGWGLCYNGSSTAPQTWTFTHDTSQTGGVDTWTILGAAFLPATP